jgi:imidazolonepropionase-like amidohydrolase
VVGTDAGISPGKRHDVLPRAVEPLANLGMAPLEMLTAMTASSAEVIGVGDRKGRLAVGFDADVLAVRGDPTTDPSALRQVVGVWRAGRRAVG